MVRAPLSPAVPASVAASSPVVVRRRPSRRVVVHPRRRSPSNAVCARRRVADGERRGDVAVAVAVAVVVDDVTTSPIDRSMASIDRYMASIDGVIDRSMAPIDRWRVGVGVGVGVVLTPNVRTWCADVETRSRASRWAVVRGDVCVRGMGVVMS